MLIEGEKCVLKNFRKVRFGTGLFFFENVLREMLRSVLSDLRTSVPIVNREKRQLREIRQRYDLLIKARKIMTMRNERVSDCKMIIYAHYHFDV